MRGGQLTLLTPQEISGYSTPVITEHLPPGAIKYNPDGRLVDTIDMQVQKGGKRSSRKSKRSGHNKRTSKKRSISKKRSSSKKARKHRRHSKTGKKSRKY